MDKAFQIVYGGEASAGRNPAASLKRRQDRGDGQARAVGFRGAYPAASLKPDPTRRQNAGFRGASPRGLIEALAPTPAERRPPPASAGRTPRPH